MPLRKNNNLQEVVDSIRWELQQGFGGFYRLHGDGIPKGILLEVRPDGVTWRVGVTIGKEYADEVAVDPKEFISNLYVLVVSWLKKASEKEVERQRAVN
jgi:hypothetical protein